MPQAISCKSSFGTIYHSSQEPSLWGIVGFPHMRFRTWPAAGGKWDMGYSRMYAGDC